MIKVIILLALIVFSVKQVSLAQDELELLDSSDMNVLNDSSAIEDAATSLDEGSGNEKATEEINVADELEDLKTDIGINYLIEKKSDPVTPQINTTIDNKNDAVKTTSGTVLNSATTKEDGKIAQVFDVGDEEKKLLELSKFVEGKIPDAEWSEITQAAKVQQYTVQEKDNLWNIARQLFGSGFYYSKVWALNPNITNPHYIEPGMILVFDLGDQDSLPQIKVGDFSNSKVSGSHGSTGDKTSSLFDFDQFGDESSPGWLSERDKLIKQGIYFQFASEETYDDLANLSKKNLNTEYEKYDPPKANIIIQEPGEQYDDSGFDKTSRITFDFSEGFFLNTFVTSNIVADLGYIDSIPKESIYINKFDTTYVKLDDSLKVRPGDMFSIYTAEGKTSHPITDRDGYRFTIVAQIEAIRPINHLWECKVTEVSGLVKRGDRVTSYVAKINKILKTFSKRNIEAAIIDAYRDTANGLSYGDVIYLDRGRADGVELGTVFEVYSFYDRGTKKRITPDPTYKIGELTVITLTDNFSTALITNSSSEIFLGALSFSKSPEKAAVSARLKNQSTAEDVKKLEANALDELDVELNLDNISSDLLNKAENIQLTEDELEELERKEREKSIIKAHEADLKELEKLESEILEAEKAINQNKIDEDSYLEQQNLNLVEKEIKDPDVNAFESLNDIEKEVGLKYLDQDLNAKENPYGLTELDIEEIDELLNTDL